MAKITINIDLNNQQFSRIVCNTLLIALENENLETLLKQLPPYEGLKNKHNIPDVFGILEIDDSDNPEHEVFVEIHED